MQCSYFDAGKCHSCTLMGTPYEAQVVSKQAKVSALLPKVDFWDTPFCGPERGFRNKAKLAVGRKGRSGPYQLGILAPGGGVQDLTACGLYEPPIRASFAPLKRALAKTDLKPYDPATHKGQLRTVIVSTNPAGELQVRFVCRTAASIVPLRRALAGLQAELPNLVAASINLHPRHVALLEGDEEVPLTEGARLTMPVGVDLQLDRRSFFQTNTTVARALYAQARQWAGPPTGKAWDLYCGVGGFALTLAKAGWEVSGVETIASAIGCARDAAAAQGLPAKFQIGDATDWALAQTEVPALVVVNPPRRGIGQRLATVLNEGGASRILYSSCNPKTLAKDLAILDNYRPTRARMFDMFPQTNHVETVCLLTRKNVAGYVNVDIDVKELKKDKLPPKPTYKQIQAYVLDKYGLKVSTLNIATVKDELGLEKQFSYEKGGMAAKNRPQCPKEKHDAIVDAFRYFKMTL